MLLTSATIGAGSATGFRRRRGRFLILAIGSGAGSGCFFARIFLLGMPRRLTSNKSDCEPGNVLKYLVGRSSGFVPDSQEEPVRDRKTG